MPAAGSVLTAGIVLCDMSVGRLSCLHGRTPDKKVLFSGTLYFSPEAL